MILDQIAMDFWTFASEKKSLIPMLGLSNGNFHGGWVDGLGIPACPPLSNPFWQPGTW